MLTFCAGVVLFFVYIFDRKMLRFDYKLFEKFLRLLLTGSCLSIVLNVLAGRFPHFPHVEVSSLLFVWQEDLLFSCLSIYYAEKILPKWAFAIVAVTSSIVFGYMHLYQGWLAAVLLSAYPYFVSYRVGKKHGFSVVMVSHVIFDFSMILVTFLIRFIQLSI